MLSFLTRFVVGGTLVASLPIVARRFGSDAAALLTMVPITTIAAYFVIYTTSGPPVVRSMALWGLVFVIPLCAYYLVIVAASGRQLPVFAVLVTAALAWIMSAGVALVFFRTVMDQS